MHEFSLIIRIWKSKKIIRINIYKREKIIRGFYEIT